jgi:hypothetical protein
MEPPKPIKPRSWSDLDWYEEARLSPAVRAGDFVFVSGCTRANLYPDDPQGQIRQAYRYRSGGGDRARGPEGGGQRGDSRGRGSAA